MGEGSKIEWCDHTFNYSRDGRVIYCGHQLVGTVTFCGENRDVSDTWGYMVGADTGRALTAATAEHAALAAATRRYGGDLRVV